MDCYFVKAVLVLLPITVILCSPPHQHGLAAQETTTIVNKNTTITTNTASTGSTASAISTASTTNTANSTANTTANTTVNTTATTTANTTEPSTTSNTTTELPKPKSDRIIRSAPIIMPLKAGNHSGNHTHIRFNRSATADNSSQHVECVCALFAIKAPIESDVPLMSKTFENVSCHGHPSVEDACTKVCNSFVLTHYKTQDKFICSVFHNGTDLNGFLHSKMCKKNGPWNFTGIQNSKPLCCKENEPVHCENKPSTV